MNDLTIFWNCSAATQWLVRARSVHLLRLYRREGDASSGYNPTLKQNAQTFNPPFFFSPSLYFWGWDQTLEEARQGAFGEE